MLTASELRSMAQHEITDTQYIMANVQCKLILTAFDGGSECWARFNTRYLKNKPNLESVANEVVRILRDNGFEAEFETFADAEYEEYLRFKISWED